MNPRLQAILEAYRGSGRRPGMPQMGGNPFLEMLRQRRAQGPMQQLQPRTSFPAPTMEARMPGQQLQQQEQQRFDEQQRFSERQRFNQQQGVNPRMPMPGIPGPIMNAASSAVRPPRRMM